MPARVPEGSLARRIAELPGERYEKLLIGLSSTS